MAPILHPQRSSCTAGAPGLRGCRVTVRHTSPVAGHRPGCRRAARNSRGIALIQVLLISGIIGLLMLQSRLNAGKGPALYLCPDNYLIDQTCDQARQFGIATCNATPDIPEEFLSSNKILVTSVQKLFNGLTRFGLNRQSVAVGSLLMDDAHACSDIVREACRIRIPREEPAYHALRTLFSGDLESQGVGTFADICNNQRDALLPVPYWAWLPREAGVAQILSDNAKRDSVKFAWPLLKDMLSQCQCIFTGTALEIEPYIAPLSAFGSYWESPHRIFMSATVTVTARVPTNPASGVTVSWLPATLAVPPTVASYSRLGSS